MVPRTPRLLRKDSTLSFNVKKKGNARFVETFFLKGTHVIYRFQ